LLVAPGSMLFVITNFGKIDVYIYKQINFPDCFINEGMF
jgi:hypothetical protein